MGNFTRIDGPKILRNNLTFKFLTKINLNFSSRVSGKLFREIDELFCIMYYGLPL